MTAWEEVEIPYAIRTGDGDLQHVDNFYHLHVGWQQHCHENYLTTVEVYTAVNFNRRVVPIAVVL